MKHFALCDKYEVLAGSCTLINTMNEFSNFPEYKLSRVIFRISFGLLNADSCRYEHLFMKKTNALNTNTLQFFDFR